MSGVSLGQGGACKAARPFVGSGGDWKPARAMFVGQGGVWRQVYSSAPPPAVLSAMISPSYTDWGFDGTTLVGGPFTCTASGGSPPYSYLWAGGDPVNPSGETTVIRGMVAYHQVVSCHVADSASGEAFAVAEIIP